MIILFPHMKKALSHFRSFCSFLLVIALILPLLSGCASLDEDSSSFLYDPRHGNQRPQVSSSIPTSDSEESSEPVDEGHDEAPEEAETSADTAFYDPSGVDYARLLASRNQTYVEGSGNLTPTGDLSPKANAVTTLMIYMTGSNLESVSARATLDILEMQEAGVSFENVNLILYTGGCQSWRSNIPSTTNSVIDLSKDPSEYIVASTAANASMGASETLREFINFTTEYYPADHYGLIFWDHGGGPLWGYGNDELFSGDALMLSEMKEAMEDTMFQGGTKLDYVGFDACLMGSFEVMRLWSNYAKYMIASEELEPGDGWDYHFLSVLNETSDPIKIGKQIVADYRAYYDSISTDTYQPNITLSLVDLEKAGNVSTALESLFSAMAEGLQTGQFTTLKRIRMEAKSFGIVETRDSGTYYYDLVDLSDLVSQMSSLYEDECQAVTKALEGFVLSHTSTMDHTGGVSLYYPSQNKGQYEKLSDAYREISGSDAYMTYLEDATMGWLYSKSRDWILGEMTETEDELLLSLTEDQLDHMASCYYTIIFGAEGIYSRVIDTVHLSPDDEGVLHIPTEPIVFYFSGNGGYSFMLPVRQIEADGEKEIYQTVDTYLYSDLYRYNREAENLEVPVTITFSYDKSTEETTILSITATQNEFSLGSKDSLDLSQWSSLFCLFYNPVPVRDQLGRLLPFSQWAVDEMMRWTISMPLNGDITIERVKTDYRLYYQMVLEDENGEKYATDLYSPDNIKQPFSSVGKYATENGELSFIRYPDHVLIERYDGFDSVLTIPETIDGLPVTEVESLGQSSSQFTSMLTKVELPSGLLKISHSAFNHCTLLESITIPESVTFIGDEAFSYCTSLKEITIPSNVTYLGDGCFDSCTSLESVTLPPVLENEPKGLFFGCSSLKSILGEAKGGYQLTQGALYTEDGSKLLAYPAALTGSFTVSQGTTEIGFGAFSETSLESITLPEGIRVLAPYAFLNCHFSFFPQLPDSLEQIGFRCFGAEYHTIDYDTMASDPVEIHLGPNVLFLGEQAFTAFPSRYFTVAEENGFYASLDGCLVNKAKDTLYEFSASRKLNYIVPEGITVFDYKALSVLSVFVESEYLSFDLFLPESLQEVTGEIPLMIDRILFHAPVGSYAQRLASENGFAWDSEMQTDYTIATVPTEKGMIYARVYEDHAMILFYNGDDLNIVIPETIESVPVTILGNGSDPIEYFEGFREGIYADLDLDKESLSVLPLLSIGIPETVTTISAHCFEVNPLIAESLTIPENVTVIGDDALPYKFSGDPYVLPDSLEFLGRNNMGYCEPIPITDHTKYISPNQFFQEGTEAGFVQLSENDLYQVIDGSLYSADGTTLIRWGSNHTNAVTLPEGITTIGPYALSFTSFSSVQLPDSLTTIEPLAFTYCQLTSIVFPKDLLTIGEDAFSNCSKLTEVIFNEGLTYLGSYAFSLTGLVQIKLPDSLAYIGEACFAISDDSCVKAGETFTLAIGKELLFIGPLAFDSLPISNYIVDPDNPAYTSVNGLLYDKTKNILIDCPCGKSGAVYIGEKTSMIKSYAFHGCVDVTDLYLPSVVSCIQLNTFDDDCCRVNNHGQLQRYPGYWITLHVVQNSYAHHTAERYGYPYILEKKIKTFTESE